MFTDLRNSLFFFSIFVVLVLVLVLLLRRPSSFQR